MGAAWVWLGDRRPGDAETLAGFAAACGVREAFVSVPWGGPDQRVRATVAALRRTGMRVAALGGSAEWAERSSLARQWAVRADTGGLFDEMHLDIEPWTLPDWSTSAPALLAGIAEAARVVGEATGRPVEVDLAPHVATTHPTGFLQVAHAAAVITLMSYRDTARESVAVSTQARRLLAPLGRRYRLAVDTLPSGDPGSSFAGRPRREMDVVVAQVETVLRSDRDFRGVAVHDLIGWAALPE